MQRFKDYLIALCIVGGAALAVSLPMHVIK